MSHTTTTNDSRSTGYRARRRVSLLVAVPLLIAVLAACQSNTGLSSEDAAAIKEQIQQVASRLDAVEERLIDLSQSSSDAPALLISEVRAATSDVGAAKTILADVSSQLEVSVPDEASDGAIDDAIDGANDFGDETLPDLNDDTLPDLDNDINDGRDALDPLLNQSAPDDLLPGLDAAPSEQESAPLGN